MIAERHQSKASTFYIQTKAITIERLQLLLLVLLSIEMILLAVLVSTVSFPTLFFLSIFDKCHLDPYIR